MNNNDLTIQQMQGLVAELVKVNTDYVEAIMSRDTLAIAQERRIAELEQRVRELECCYDSEVKVEVSE